VNGAEPPAASPAASPGSDPSLAGSRTVGGTLILAATRLLGWLPEAPLVAAAESIGEIWYRLAPTKAAQARANLGRVCQGLAAQGRGSERTRRAATDPEALEGLVRACFRHTARYYLEVARAGSYDLETALARVGIDTPDEIREGLMSGHPIVLVGMHYGAIELPVVLLSHLVDHRVTAPMEAVTDPGLQRWFVTSRSRVGVDIVPLRDARRKMLRALRRGESVGMVNDRDLTHTGIPVPFFGADAPISPGPALLAIQAGVPVYVGWARRRRGGRYAAGLAALPVPETGTRRERMTALTANIAAAFESVLADAPEQWWGAFHPIWPDLAVGEGPGADDGGPRHRGGTPGLQAGAAGAPTADQDPAGSGDPAALP
jgi:lauroyl/myristoyl acyltransferase